MKRTLIATLACMIFLALPLAAQPGGTMKMRHPGMGGGSDGPGGGRFDTFRKMRMIEALKLKEDDAARFVAKETAHSDAVKKLMDSRNDLLDDLRKSLKDDGGKVSDKTVSDILAIDEKMFQERKRHQDELKAFLSPEQFARYLVFEREFGRGVRDAIQGVVKDRRKMMKERDGDGGNEE